MKQFPHAGLVAIVTGGNSGIGAATASALHAAGSSVAVADRVVDRVPHHMFGIEVDVTCSEQVDAAVAAVRQQFGGLDMLINCAGIGAVGSVEESLDEDWTKVLDVNVVGIARITRAALPMLRKSEHPSITNVCSAVAYIGVRQRAVYSASKGAVHALTLAMAADLAEEGIRVNAVAPGTVQTPWVERLLAGADDPDHALRQLQKRQPIGRLVTADEVAAAILALASPAASATTGAVLRVDGGMTSLRV